MVALSALVLILVSGLRYKVGVDYGGYMTSYSYRAHYFFNDLLAFQEPGLGFIAWVSRFIYDDYVTMFLNAAILTVGLNVITIRKYTKWFAVSILLYIFIGAWHGSFNAVRQYLAAAVIFAGHRYILDKKFIKYCLVILLACAFHKTALIMLPVYFLGARKLNFVTLLLVAGLTVLMRFSYDFFFDIMSEIKGKDQTKYGYMQQSVHIARVLVAVSALFLPFLSYKGFLKNNENRFYFNMLMINAGLMVAASGSAYLARIAIYTDIFATIAFPLFLKGMPKGIRTLMTSIILILYAAFWYTEVSTRLTLNDFHWIFER